MCMPVYKAYTICDFIYRFCFIVTENINRNKILMPNHSKIPRHSLWWLPCRAVAMRSLHLTQMSWLNLILLFEVTEVAEVTVALGGLRNLGFVPHVQACLSMRSAWTNFSQTGHWLGGIMVESLLLFALRHLTTNGGEFPGLTTYAREGNC